MEKTVLLLAGLLTLMGSVQAQDTVNGNNLSKERYFFNEDAWEHRGSIQVAKSDGTDIGQVAMGLYTADSLEIYGLAGCVINLLEREESPYFVYDTSDYTHSFEYLRLYLPDGDSLRWIAQEKVHLRTTPIAYYANFDTMVPPRNKYIAPMYEVFFDSAITVIDSFAVGMTYFNREYPYYDADSNRYQYHYPPLSPGSILLSPGHYVDRYNCFYREDGNGPYALWYHVLLGGWYTLWFPILVPDTTTGGGTEPDDSLAVQVALVDRLVAVQPNPATERVKVVASCGMERVTAYNAAGVKVYDQAATGLSTTLEVTGWPAGTYILHIQTPMGVSTKRLVVAR